jgi:alcohol dehydrogenase class IV
MSFESGDTDLLAFQDWTFPIAIAYGPGRLSEIGERCAGLGLAQPADRDGSWKPRSALHWRTSSSPADAGLACAIFSDISPNPRDDEIGAGRDAFRAGRHDAIIAIGGGSAMDGGKAICLTANNDMDLWAFEFEQTSPVHCARPTVPVTDHHPDDGRHRRRDGKHGDGHPCRKRHEVLHLASGPEAIAGPARPGADDRAAGKPDRLDRRGRADPCHRGLLRARLPPAVRWHRAGGAEPDRQWLPVAVREPDNMAARGGMLVGSCLAGIAFLKGLGMVHAISHMVGAEYNTQHGLTNAVILPVVLRYNLPGMDAKVQRMAEAMRLSDTSVEGFISAVERLLDDIDIPTSLGEIGVPADCVDRIAAKSLKDSAASTNPRKASLDDARMLVEQALSRAR